MDVEFAADKLADKLNWYFHSTELTNPPGHLWRDKRTTLRVMDIGVAMDVLKTVLTKYNLKNLDEIFPGENTTTEFMCKKVFEGLSAELQV